jgi:hypothetical protein
VSLRHPRILSRDIRHSFGVLRSRVVFGVAASRRAAVLPSRASRLRHRLDERRGSRARRHLLHHGPLARVLARRRRLLVVIERSIRRPRERTVIIIPRRLRPLARVLALGRQLAQHPFEGHARRALRKVEARAKRLHGVDVWRQLVSHSNLHPATPPSPRARAPRASRSSPARRASRPTVARRSTLGDERRRARGGRGAAFEIIKIIRARHVDASSRVGALGAVDVARGRRGASDVRDVRVDRTRGGVER